MNSRTQSLADALVDVFGRPRVRFNEPLARHCNWRVGGPADLFLVVHTADELVRALTLAHNYQHQPCLLGFGANVLVSDRGIRGMVILNRAHRIEFQPDGLVEADSGTNLAVLAKEAAKQGVAGLEFLVGIPGTVGAAVAVNAGTRTRWISAAVEQVRVFTRSGNLEWRLPEQLGFAYRHSKLKESGEVVITARLRGTPDQPERIEARLREELQVRKSQPTGPSAGSVFTNPPGDFAGRLIEACGLKGFQIGGARVSEMHANFILNTGNATANHIKAVIEHVKAEVAERFGIELTEEIRYLGEW